MRADREEAAAELQLLESALRDLRDDAGADEAIFWRWVEQRGVLSPDAWSTADAPRPQFFRMAEWAPLAQWTAEERRVQHDSADGAVRFVAVPVMRGEALIGVLTLSRESGLALPGGDDRMWLDRHARGLDTLLAFSEALRGRGRHLRLSDALLEAVRQIHQHRTPETLARSVCEMATDITGAHWSGLVRWFVETGAGELEHATDGLGITALHAVAVHSMVSEACHEGRELVMEDASDRHPDAVLFAERERLASIGSLAIVPIFQDETPIGAIVVASPDVGAIGRDAVDQLRHLGAAASASLEKLWDLEAASRRATTDQLTGLKNRRYFDEQIVRVLAETDRYGGSAALVLVDIDHFKKVNDGYGHDAGDAVLRAVARTLGEGVRTVDVCARFGGEEIAILLPQTDLQGAVEIADRMRRTLEERIVRHGLEEIRVTASFGVASYPGCARSRDGLFPAADKALYEAKREGRNRVKAAQVIASHARA